MKVLNLYSGIGGNRKLWQNVEVTAVELNPDIATIYQDFFPNDKVIVADAHEYLLQHFAEYDFIWSSPPCQSHSQIRYNIGYLADRKYSKVKPIYPDMTLYQEIIFLQHFAKGLWVVENVQPYYKPLIPAKEVGSHLFWSNYHIPNINTENRNHRGGTVETLQDRKLFDISNYSINNKRQILRNCVEPELGLHVFNCAIGAIPPIQEGLFAESESKKYV